MTFKKRLGELLVDAGVIDEAQLQAALGHQRKWGGRLGQALIDLKLATEPQIVAALSQKLGYEIVEVSALVRTPPLDAALKHVPRELALRHVLLPIAADAHSITVVMADPSNIALVDEISFRTGRRVKLALAGDREIAAAVRRLYFPEEEAARVPTIPLEETPAAAALPLERTRDPFAAMPDQLRNPAPAISPEAQPAAPRRAASALSARVDVQPNLTPPPIVPREPVAHAELAARVPAPERLATPLSAGAPDLLLGEPILAAELAPGSGDEAFVPMSPEQPLTPRQAAVLDALARLARGEDSAVLKPAQVAAALARLLVRRGIVREQELLDELAPKP